MVAAEIEEALRAVGRHLEAGDVEGPVCLYLVGGSAGLLSGWLPGARTTGDVDVGAVDPGECWDAVRRAAREVAGERGLPATWLNDECRIFRWSLPLGWRERCRRALGAGPLEVWTPHRQDFIAAKVVSAPRRPQDVEDLQAIRPTAEEPSFAGAHLDRLERESFDPGASFDDARTIVQVLRGEA